MRTLLLLLLVAAPALGQTRVVIVRPGHRPIVLSRRAPMTGTAAGAYQGRVTVAGANRFDWQFAAPPGLLATMPKDAAGGFAESYQLLVPPGFQADKPAGLVLHLSASSTPNDYEQWEPVCRKYGLIYAAPYGVGDEAHAGLRLRTALAVLDDLRQRATIDTDRVYVAGVGQGALTASMVAYSYPEFVGGLLAVGAATSLRSEPWMRDRVRERLSVVLMAGSLDPGRHELERVRAAVLKEYDVKHRMMTIPGVAKGLPPAGVLEQAVARLESGRSDRAMLGKTYPATRVPERAMPTADGWAAAVVDEAKVRMKKGRNDEGLLQLQGVVSRWPATAAAKDARRLLDEHDAKGKRPWREGFDRRQVEFFSREAAGLDEFAALVRGTPVHAGVIAAAVAMYEEVEKFGPDTREAKKAAARLEQLRKVKR